METCRVNHCGSAVGVGDKVTVLKGKYAYHEGVVLSFNISHDPVLYVVLMGNGKEIAVYETEIEIMERHIRNFPCSKG